VASTSYPHLRRAQQSAGKRGRGLAAVTVLGAAASVGAAVGWSMASPGASQPAVASACRVVDGDTLRCGSERVRLLGIDAPELPGHCAAGRLCAPGDPYASSRSLEQALAGNLKVTRVGLDRYGRTLALVAGNKGDLSCWQLQHDQATYKPNWDNDGRVAALCPRYAR
jgi:micrococcal nuclease